jgi:UDP-3-O-acyl N-acetylglucosamine deacetylase
MIPQKTIAEPCALAGYGLHTGCRVNVLFQPAPPDHGIVFRRIDLPETPPVPAEARYVASTARGTVLARGGAEVHTIEHCMAALAGLDIDNLLIEIDAPEIPIGDGSAIHITDTLISAGIPEQDRPKKVIAPEKALEWRHGGTTLTLSPGRQLRIDAVIEFENTCIGRQEGGFIMTPEVFHGELAPARTFCFVHEVERLREQGLIQGGNLECAVVLGETGPVNGSFRFPDECLRHKILDLLGDSRLAGYAVRGHISAQRPGHAANTAFAADLSRHPTREAAALEPDSENSV